MTYVTKHELVAYTFVRLYGLEKAETFQGFKAVPIILEAEEAKPLSADQEMAIQSIAYHRVRAAMAASKTAVAITSQRDVKSRNSQQSQVLAQSQGEVQPEERPIHSPQPLQAQLSFRFVVPTRLEAIAAAAVAAAEAAGAIQRVEPKRKRSRAKRATAAFADNSSASALWPAEIRTRAGYQLLDTSKEVQPVDFAKLSLEVLIASQRKDAKS